MARDHRMRGSCSAGLRVRVQPGAPKSHVGEGSYFSSSSNGRAAVAVIETDGSGHRSHCRWPLSNRLNIRLREELWPSSYGYLIQAEDFGRWNTSAMHVTGGPAACPSAPFTSP